MRKATRKMSKVIYSNLDGIVKAANEIATAWDRKTIPLTDLANMIDVLKSSDIANNEEAKEFVEAYYSMLDILFDTCKKAANKLQSKFISVEYLKGAIELIKTEMNKTLK